MRRRWRLQLLFFTRSKTPARFSEVNATRLRNCRICPFDSSWLGYGYGPVIALGGAFDGFTIDHNPVPRLEIQQTPNAITMIPASRAVIRKYILDSFRPEKTPLHASGCEEHALQFVQLGST